MPQRPRSYRGPPVAIISMAQQASPNVAGHTQGLRVRLTSFSTVDSSMPLGSFPSIPMSASVPLQTAAAPLVQVGDADGHDEQQHREEPTERELIERNRPRHQEDDLDVEDDEHHRG